MGDAPPAQLGVLSSLRMSSKILPIFLGASKKTTSPISKGKGWAQPKVRDFLAFLQRNIINIRSMYLGIAVADGKAW